MDCADDDAWVKHVGESKLLNLVRPTGKHLVPGVDRRSTRSLIPIVMGTSKSKLAVVVEALVPESLRYPDAEFKHLEDSPGWLNTMIAALAVRYRAAARSLHPVIVDRSPWFLAATADVPLEPVEAELVKVGVLSTLTRCFNESAPVFLYVEADPGLWTDEDTRLENFLFTTRGPERVITLPFRASRSDDELIERAKNIFEELVPEMNFCV